jgi:hypothetical protein
MSANQTSPCLGLAPIEYVQHFLLDLAIGQHVAPLGFLPLLYEEPQEMKHFALHRLRLPVDFLDQQFMRAHTLILLCRILFSKDGSWYLPIRMSPNIGTK